MSQYEDNFGYDDFDDFEDYTDPDFARHKKRDRIKWILTAAAFLLVAVMLVGLCLQCFGSGKQKPSEWFAGDGKETSVADGLLVSDAESNSSGIALMSAVIPRAQFATYGVSPAAESAQTVTASFKDYDGDPLSETDTERVKLSWTLAWKTESGWGKGKTVTEYISLSTGDDTHSATVSCLQPFGEQILLKASVDGDSGVSNSVTIDYRQRYSSWKTTIKFPQNALTVDFGEQLIQHTSRFVAVDFPSALESMTLDTTGGSVQFSVIGTDVYTLPLEFTVGGCKTKCVYPAQITAAGGYALENYAFLLGARYDEGSHTWNDVYLHSLLGLSMGSDASGFTVKKYRSTLSKQGISGLDTPIGAVSIQFTDVKVNGQPVESSDEFTFSLQFNARSLWVSASSVEFDYPGLVF